MYSVLKWLSCGSNKLRDNSLGKPQQRGPACCKLVVPNACDELESVKTLSLDQNEPETVEEDIKDKERETVAVGPIGYYGLGDGL